MTRTAQNARLLEAAMEELRPKFPLCGLIESAVDAADAFSALFHLPSETVTDEEYCRADELAYDTKLELLAFMLTHHNINRALARKLGALL